MYFHIDCAFFRNCAYTVISYWSFMLFSVSWTFGALLEHFLCHCLFIHYYVYVFSLCASCTSLCVLVSTYVFPWWHLFVVYLLFIFMIMYYLCTFLWSAYVSHICRNVGYMCLSQNTLFGFQILNLQDTGFLAFHLFVCLCVLVGYVFFWVLYHLFFSISYARQYSPHLSWGLPILWFDLGFCVIFWGGG